MLVFTLSRPAADPNAAAPFEELVKDNDHDMVGEVLAMLNSRESEILAMRFGLDDGTPKTLEEVADHLGITRERVRQLQEKALDKMRERIAKRDPLSNPLKKAQRNRLSRGRCALSYPEFGE